MATLVIRNKPSVKIYTSHINKPLVLLSLPLEWDRDRVYWVPSSERGLLGGVGVMALLGGVGVRERLLSTFWLTSLTNCRCRAAFTGVLNGLLFICNSRLASDSPFSTAGEGVSKWHLDSKVLVDFGVGILDLKSFIEDFSVEFVVESCLWTASDFLELLWAGREVSAKSSEVEESVKLINASEGSSTV